MERWRIPRWFSWWGAVRLANTELAGPVRGPGPPACLYGAFGETFLECRSFDGVYPVDAANENATSDCVR